MNKITKFTFLLLFFAALLEAQSFERYHIDFLINGKKLENPLIGGINTPQLSKIDFNNDGIQDLYIFDRAANVHLCFLHDGVAGSTNYTFAPEYADNFPKLEHFVLLRDYNLDGIADIFAYSDIPGIAGMTVFEGYYENNHIAFRKYDFPKEQNFEVIHFPLSSGSLTNLYVALNDYPAVDDIDSDGDMDILTFNSAGGFVEYYVNQSIEKGFGSDSLIYQLEDNCWGGFYESGLSPAVDLSDQMGRCFDAALEVESRHAGSTVLSLRLDEDCDKDLILGDLSFKNLIMLENGGDCEEAWITDQDINFPSYDVPAMVAQFPAAFYLDIDNDGFKDLVTSPNENENTEDYSNIWFYKNIGDNDSPEFDLQNRSLITATTLDFGSGSNPTFVDCNQDGLMDIVVGTVGYFLDAGNRDPRLFLLENIGTPTTPLYQLVDDDFLDFSQFKELTWNFTPTFGDLDSDGDLDLLVGEEFGTIFWVENIGGVNGKFEKGNIIANYMNIDIGASSAPHLADINGDGLLDLLIGERNGNINYFQNVGTTTQANFNSDPTLSPNTQLFGRIDAREPGFITGYSAPIVFQDGTSKKVITGSAKGQLELYEINSSNLAEVFPLENELLGNIEEGNRSRVALADINKDGILEALVGNYRGGLALYSTDILDDTSVANKDIQLENDFKIFPNPVHQTVYWKDTKLDIDKIRLTSILGKVILEVNVSRGVTELSLPENLSPGAYYLSFFKDELTIGVRKIIVQH